MNVRMLVCIQPEMIFPEGEKTLLLHTGQLRRHSAAVYAQIIGQSLTVKGNREGKGSGLPGHEGQIVQELFSCGAPGQKTKLLIEHDVSFGQNPNHLFSQKTVEGTALLTGSEDFFSIEEKNGGFRYRKDCDRQMFCSCTAEGFRKKFRRLHNTENRLISKYIRGNDLNASREYDPDEPRGLSGRQDFFLSSVASGKGAEAGEHLRVILF